MTRISSSEPRKVINYEPIGSLDNLYDFTTGCRDSTLSCEVMACMPYAMKMVEAEKKRRTEQQQSQSTHLDEATAPHYGGFRNPTKYSTNMMNSIWGMYNQYSVHNFKSKQCDGVEQGASEVEGSVAAGSKISFGNSTSNNSSNNNTANFLYDIAQSMSSSFKEPVYKFH